MSDPWKDIGATRSPETYQEALSRCESLNQTKSALSEAERAAKMVMDKAHVKQHDAYFKANFITLSEEIKISRTLARQFGLPDQAEEVIE